MVTATTPTASWNAVTLTTVIIPKPSAVERALFWLGLWPWVSDRSLWIARGVAVVVLILGVIAFRRRVVATGSV